MAQQLYFSRDSKLFIEWAGTTGLWEVPILDGFSFSQATNSSEITLAEMESTTGSSRRGRRLFNDSLAPVEWSFSTYMRPFKSAGGGAAGNADNAAEVHSVEEVLWALMAAADTYSSYQFTRAANAVAGPVVTPATGSKGITFAESNRSVLPTATLYFFVNTAEANPVVYKLTNGAVNEAAIDFDVDGIATINWSGFAKNIVDMQSAGDVFVQAGSSFSISRTAGDVILDNTDDFKLGLYTGATAGVMATDAGVDSTAAFIRNRLTQCIVNTTDTTAFPSGDYYLTLTGGNVTVSNNITYLVPEELGNVNLPIEGVTGGRTVSGNFTCYLTLDTAGANRGSSVDLFNDMTTSGKGLDKVVNDFQVTFQIGGATADIPRLYINMPKVHIDVPVHSVEDVISVETGFGAYTDDFDKADELVLTYFGDTASANQQSYP